MTRVATERFLTALLVSVGGTLVAVLAGRPDAAVLAAPWVVLLMVGLIHRTPPTPGVALELSDARVVVGDDIDVTTTITGASGSVRVTCLPSERFAATPPRTNRASVDDVIVSGRGSITHTLEATEWGRHDLGTHRVEITEPYGLFRREGVVGRAAPLLVHPHPQDLHDLVAPWLVRRISGAHTSREVGRGVEYADIRPFTAGDSIREINWRASARSDDMWVSQAHPDRATDVVLFLDSFVEAGHDVRAVVGRSIEAAVGLAESHLAVSDRVGLVELGGIVRWVTPRSGRLQLQRITDGLLSTGLFANAAERDLAVIPPRVLPPRSFVVALSPLLDDRFIEALLVLAGRGHDVAVIECAPVVDGEISVARRLWHAERDVLRDGLTDHGIAVAIWEDDAPLDAVLRDLGRRRRAAGGARR